MADSMCGDDDAHAAMLSAFKQLVADDVAVPVAAMNCLVMTIQRSSASTWMELESEMKASISALMKDCKNDDLRGRTNLSLASGCELFMMYVTRAFSVLHSSAEFSKCRDELVRRGEAFASMSNAARSRIASFGEVFVQENSTVLIHGYSRVVMSILLRAAKTKAFNVVLPEGRPNCEETSLARESLTSAGIAVEMISDNAVGCRLSRGRGAGSGKVDFCLVGAEGVVESGGVVNKIALVAKALGVPLYVAVESYKFARTYPLTQEDVTSVGDGSDASQAAVDLTPADLVRLMFTDLGTLTPAAVSDELIRLYQ